MAWLNIFGRLTGQSPSIPDGDSVEDWKRGDLAECTARNGWFRNGTKAGPGPAFGEIRLVEAVTTWRVRSGAMVQCLVFARFPDHYDARGFRKITPRADAATSAEPAFIADLTKQPVTEDA